MTFPAYRMAALDTFGHTLKKMIGLVYYNSGLGGNKSGTKPSTNTQTASNTASTGNNQQAEQSFGLNQEAQDGDLAFTVTGVEKLKTVGNSFTQKSAQGMFYVVSLKIENKGKKTVTFDSSMVKIAKQQY